MSLVVFMRGVNVGGHKAFKPSTLAKQLTEFDVVSIGAAGTFVVRKKISQAALRAALLNALPFEPEMMICRAQEVLALAAADPFADQKDAKGIVRYVTVLVKLSRTPPELPLGRPEGRDWQVKVIEARGRFVLSLHRRLGRRLIYPNEVVEKAFGVPATTRNWSTIAAVNAVLNEA